ncbi:MAG: hypothetical protein A2887_00565 [Alphaproteobacteria bacterium RIFCSPLOWO2_01_FULL_40_26]|nr:MAG: hypothetical protein A3D15_00935 [Alphaproteobacteria bacterium RIFCSPHIGHO2_02_FULL_40_34]OFW87108.1 MAG: hypothetical protein A2794_01030 [Alphaproteobacteria bacterium RIFCSPHIGHO2_01_FULL_40_8]OFW94681.1 MAG: hypothetical protein A2887_00565 [Alphaproteobacteria bacterium RIFCSPLOWO2_01_FULL_40_26]OFX10149.1 MAG: hypothetical protein A3H30_05025 [Alphaproteobacteria bacterium RIFCSPLOWO2_02_FULL_40_19]OFX11778.1 MAG: hypothetical protein A3G22_04615 [Alphaproteobacteria bacterium RI
MLKFLLKIWPGLLPITVYVFWVFVIEGFLFSRILKRKTEFEGEKIVGEKSTEVKVPGKFSLQNRHFVAVLYASLILAILTLIFSAFK